jgi:inner membrane protein
MDLLTQGLLGSNLALSLASTPATLRKTALIGLLAGLAADVDFLIHSADDPLLNLEFHRHFTHSLSFVPVAALILSVLFWPFVRASFSWPRLYAICFLGYALSGFLDACTSYGTSLLWPLSDTRFSFNIIAIIDPVFSLLLLIGLVAALVSRRKALAYVGLALAAAYLTLGWVQNARVQAITQALAQDQGHDPQRLLVRPTLGNLWLWRSVYLHADEYHVNALRLNPFTRSVQVFIGGRIARYEPDTELGAIPADSVLGQDIRRFQRFTNDYLARDPATPTLITDVRYANLPTQVEPLWAIRIDPSQPQRHADYELFRDRSRANRQAFVDMLLGRGG